MSLQLRFGLFGAAFGLFLGIVGGILSGIPFGIVLFRSLLIAIGLGLAGFLLYTVINKLIPELANALQGNESAEVLSSTGGTIDITLAEDDDSSPSENARMLYSDSSEENQYSAARAEGDGIVEELRDDTRYGKVANDNQVDFNEDEFYNGVEHLPDIGGFSDQFQSNEANDESDSASSLGSSSGKKQKSGDNKNMDPALIAQAIRTALHKDDH